MRYLHRVVDAGDEHLSKLLSYLLRHRPEALGLTLDAAGWVDVDTLLQALRAEGRTTTRADLERLLQHGGKLRFALSPDGRRMRASQGHSRPVELGYAPREPPDCLYHGTVARALPSIELSGLEKRERHHVHLSATSDEALRVGARRGRALVLEVDARAMHAAGHTFYRADNGVWLTLHVPVGFIAFPPR